MPAASSTVFAVLVPAGTDRSLGDRWIKPQDLLHVQRQAVEALAHVGVTGRQPDGSPAEARSPAPAWRHHRAKRRRHGRRIDRAFDPDLGPAAQRDLDRARRWRGESGRITAPVLWRRGPRARDLDRQKPQGPARRRSRRASELPPPFEQLVGVHVMAACHARHRGARLRQSRHDLPALGRYDLTFVSRAVRPISNNVRPELP